jgi:hypothetical protein
MSWHVLIASKELGTARQLKQEGLRVKGKCGCTENLRPTSRQQRVTKWPPQSVFGNLMTSATRVRAGQAQVTLPHEIDKHKQLRAAALGGSLYDH